MTDIQTQDFLFQNDICPQFMQDEPEQPFQFPDYFQLNTPMTTDYQHFQTPEINSNDIQQQQQDQHNTEEQEEEEDEFQQLQSGSEEFTKSMNKSSKKISKASKGTNVKWNADEDKILIDKFFDLGSAWQAIEQYLPNKSRVNIKNHFHSALSKAIKEQSNQTISQNENQKVSQKQSTLSQKLKKFIISEEIYTKAKKNLENEKIQMEKDDKIKLQSIVVQRQRIFLCQNTQQLNNYLELLLQEKQPDLRSQILQSKNLVSQQAGYLRSQLLSIIQELTKYQSENFFISEEQQIFRSTQQVQQMIKSIDATSEKLESQVEFVLKRNFNTEEEEIRNIEIQTIFSGFQFLLLEIQQKLEGLAKDVQKIMKEQ